MSVIEAEELHDFFARIGEAVYTSQLIEGSLHQLLAINIDFKKQKPTRVDADRVLEEYRKKTLGALIKIAIENSLFDNILQEKLSSFNKERKWLIHRMQEDIDRKFRNDSDLRLEISSRISEISVQGYALQTDLTEWSLNTLDPNELKKLLYILESEIDNRYSS